MFDNTIRNGLRSVSGVPLTDVALTNDWSLSHKSIGKLHACSVAQGFGEVNMIIWRNILRRSAMSVLLVGLAVSNSGCTLLGGFTEVAFHLAGFWETTPLIPVVPYWSQKIEDKYWEEERYDKVPILDPVEGENAPIFCLDPPSPDEVMRALPDNTEGGVWFVTETARNNVRMTVEPIVDRVDDCRHYPMVGPARLHHCHYKCTVFFDETIRSTWPIPFSHTDAVEEVVYIDHDHLIRCSGPVVQ